MASDNVVANPGSGGATFRAFYDGTADWPCSVASYITGGSAGAWTVQQVDTTHGLPVWVLGTIPVSGTFWQATQPVSVAATVNVAVASALPAGTNVIGGVTQSGSWSVSIGAALPAGSNLIGGVELVDSGGVNKVSISSAGAVKVDGSSVTQPVSGTVTAVQGNTWSVAVTDSVPLSVVLTAGSVLAGEFKLVDSGGSNLASISAAGAVKVDGSAVTQPVSGAVTANAGTGNFTVVQSTASNLNATVTGSVNSTPQPGTSGGATPYHYLAAGAANQDSTVVKASPGQVYSIAGFNTNSTPVYLKLYDKATGPLSTDTPAHTLLLPGNTNGAGMVLPLPVGMAFSNGISFRITGGMADSDATAVASGAVIDITYK